RFARAARRHPPAGLAGLRRPRPARRQGLRGRAAARAAILRPHRDPGLRALSLLFTSRAARGNRADVPDARLSPRIAMRGLNTRNAEKELDAICASCESINSLGVELHALLPNGLFSVPASLDVRQAVQRGFFALACNSCGVISTSRGIAVLAVCSRRTPFLRLRLPWTTA